MQKLLSKKLMGRKGFTLAELLVVIAILAILIAIAVPVFTHMVAEANLRVNQANVHSVRSAAVAHILTHLGENDDSAEGVKLNKYIGEEKAGWVAVAKVDNNGNISELKVYVLDGTNHTVEGVHEGISIAGTLPTAGFFETETTDWFVISDSVDQPFATVKPSMGKNEGEPKVYYVQAVVTDLKED